MNDSHPPSSRGPRRRVVRRLVAGGLIVLLGSTAWSASAGAQGAEETSLVTIVHGLRGELVDVSLDGELLLPAFQPDRLTDPTPVTVGRHTVTLRPAGTPTSDAPFLEQVIDVPADRSLSLVASFRPDGSWGLASFTNDLTPTGSSGRVVFRNTAAVSAVDVTVDGGTAASSLTAGAESAQLLPAKTYAVEVQSSDAASDPLLPTSDVPVVEGSANFLYLVGQGEDVTWLSQRVDGLQAPPTLVSTGNSGLRDEARPAAAFAPLPLVAMAAGAVMIASARRRRVRRA